MKTRLALVLSAALIAVPVVAPAGASATDPSQQGDCTYTDNGDCTYTDDGKGDCTYTDNGDCTYTDDGHKHKRHKKHRHHKAVHHKVSRSVSRARS